MTLSPRGEGPWIARSGGGDSSAGFPSGPLPPAFPNRPDGLALPHGRLVPSCRRSTFRQERSSRPPDALALSLAGGRVRHEGPRDPGPALPRGEFGRAPGRERGGTYV